MPKSTAKASSAPDSANLTEAKRIFRDAPKHYQELIKKIMEKEREVMHMARRDDIHKDLCEIIRKNIPAKS